MKDFEERLESVVHHKFVPRAQTNNGQFYLEVMKRLRVAERGNMSEGKRNKTWMLHHDSTPAHTSLLHREVLPKHEMTVVPQLPYSPDLVPAEVSLVPRMTSTLKGRRIR
jgi:hypothetical protein